MLYFFSSRIKLFVHNKYQKKTNFIKQFPRKWVQKFLPFSKLLYTNFDKNKSINESNKKAIQKSRNRKIPDPKRTANKLNKMKSTKENLSWPAVSQIWALTILSSQRILRVANSTPMVDFDSRLNSLRVNLDKRFDFPTPESPIKTTLNK